MVVLLTCNNIYKLVECPVVVTADCGTNVLCDVYTGAVLAQEYFFVVIFVLALSYYICYVYAYRTVRSFEEYTFFQAF